MNSSTRKMGSVFPWNIRIWETMVTYRVRGVGFKETPVLVAGKVYQETIFCKIFLLKLS